MYLPQPYNYKMYKNVNILILKRDFETRPHNPSLFYTPAAENNHPPIYTSIHGPSTTSTKKINTQPTIK